MTADHGSDSGRQRTVAELLQQYGGESPGGGRRRRRRASEPEETPEPSSGESPASSTGSTGSITSSGSTRSVGSTGSTPASTSTGSTASVTGAEERSGTSMGSGALSALDSTWASLDSPSGRTLNPGTGGFDARNGSGEFPVSALDGLGGDPAGGGGSGSPWDRPSRGTSNAQSPDPFAPSSPYSGTGIYQAQPYRAGIYQSDPLTSSGPVRSPEDPTDQLPRYRDQAGATQLAGATPPAGPLGDGADAGPATSRGVEDSGPSTQVASRASLFEEEDTDEDDDNEVDEKTARKEARRARRQARAAERARAAAERDADSDDEAPDVPAGLDDPDDVDVEPSGFKVWAILVAQGVLGAVGGAGLWVGFRYLWLNLPVVALAAAVVATAGLVLVVRTIRGSEDLRTTMLAVLVGLIVTISPAVLLLASVR